MPTAFFIGTLRNKLQAVHTFLHHNILEWRPSPRVNSTLLPILALHFTQKEHEALEDAQRGLAEALALLSESSTSPGLRARIEGALDRCTSCCLDDTEDRERVTTALLEALS